MDLHKEIDLINRLLALQAKGHPTVKDQMLYERGYLTGLLAKILHEDAGLRTSMIQQVRKLEESRRKK